MSEVIPEGWSFEPLSSLAHYYNGRAFKPEDWSTQGLPIIRIAQISNKNAPVDHYAGSDVSTNNRITNGDLIFSWSATLAALIWNRGDAVLNQHIFKVVEKEGTDREFLHQVLLNSIEPLAELSHGSTMKHIKKSALDEFIVETPPLPEQQKIATILSSVDDVIEKTRAQIDKFKDLKTGMMQELLTQGIGHTEFKDSPVGRIPKIWSVIKVQELLADTKYALRSGPFGSALLKSELVSSGYPLLGIDNVHVEELRSVFKRFVSREKFQELEKYAVFPNDVMVTIMGTVGRCCVVPEGFCEALSSKHVWTLTLKQEKYIPQLLCWQINFSDWVKQQFLNESQGGVMESISSSTLKSLMVPLPPIGEQRKIADAHKSLSEQITRKEGQLSSLLDLKNALMQDLLTGKVRVKPDPTEVAAA